MQAGLEKEFVSDYPLIVHDKNETLMDVLYNTSVCKEEKGSAVGMFVTVDLCSVISKFL